jgi:hypothetical protein
MSQQTTQKPKPEPKPKTIQVTVTFPISPAGPLRGERPARETVGALREEAIAHFGVAADTQHSYYLTHDGRKVDDAHTIGQVAGTAHAVKFTLVKELVQG